MSRAGTLGRVLVTGATGFLGAYVALALVEAGFAVRALDLAPRRERLDALRPGLGEACECVAADVAGDPDAVRRAAQGCVGVVHLAGVMTVDCMHDPVRAARVNLLGGQAVVAAAQAAGVARFVYASSAAVYGAGADGTPRPETLYGVHKLALEGMAACAWRDGGLASIGFRPAIVYGMGESAGIAAGPSVALRAAARGKTARIGFSGRIGFVHADDVALAMRAALSDAPAEGASVCDLNGETASVADFVTTLLAERPGARVSIEGPPLRCPETLTGGDRPSWLARRPVTPISDGIRRTLAAWDARRAVTA